MQKKKSSYDAKKEKLLEIKRHIKQFYELDEAMKCDEKEQNIMMSLTIKLIWAAVENEKDK